ncbi:MAG: hypothetical protein ACRECU_04705 [Methylocella sp.]
MVLGSCNVVQQNVTAADNATIINEINCVPEKPEDTFLLRYLWLDATTSSFMVAGRFDPALARLLPANPVVVRNPVYQKLQEIVTRFGRLESPEGKGDGGPAQYSLMGKGQGEITARWQDPSSGLKKMRIYAGEENIILPDVPSLQAVFKTQEWPGAYMMTYDARYESEGWKNPQAHVDFQNAAISSVLLHAPISARLLMNYWDSMAELENIVSKKGLRLSSNLGQNDNLKSSMFRNKSIDAMLYFGQKSWPDDFLLAFGNASIGQCGEGEEYSYNFGFDAQPRQLFTLVAVIEPKYKDLQIEHIGYSADLDEQLRLLRTGATAQDSPPGVVAIKKGEMAVIPLRIELRYDLDDHESNFKPLLDVNSAESLYKRITNTTLAAIQFRAKDDLNSSGKKGPLRTIFSKSIASFKPPETRKINRTYIFGPAYNLKTITIKGRDILVRGAPAAAIALLGTAQLGSCPFLYVSDGAGEPSRVGRVLIGASKKELARLNETKLPREARTFFLSEQEPEVTYLETIVVKNSSSGEERLVASNLVIHPGEAREFRIPEEFYGDAFLKIRGYYIPLRLDQSAKGDGTPSTDAPN